MSEEPELNFSRLRLRPGAQTATDLLERLSTPEGEHHLLWEFYGDDPDRDRDFLFRRLLGEPLPTFFTLSEREPHSPENGLWTVDTKSYCPTFTSGMTLKFSLRANATIKKDGSYHDVVMNYKHELKQEGVPREEWPTEAEIEHRAGWEWLHDRDEKYGFRVHPGSFQIERHDTRRFEKKNSGRTVAIGVLDMTGHLDVVDSNRFWETVQNGIGRSKAYGCGFLMVKPP